ncbi:copper resistance CopC family protein [Ornithinimicrobium faecis]|uniref:copper resistance CopC family protein n=1 Tax=Ornithinimicrobium faecis TaxID=2934158 RepID=UPI002118EFFB|nr:copper resistance CopC family protein [Ornithinimicrobium sp. HY1745]
MSTLFLRGRRPGGRTALGALLIALWLTLTALPASAHDSIIDSDPAADEVVTTAPGELVLTFSGEISDLGVQFMVTGPEGRDVVQGTPTVDGITVTQELADELVNGDYEVTWRVTSSDGHPISGTIPFTLEAGDAPSDEVPTTDAPTGESTPTLEPTATETAPADETEDATENATETDVEATPAPTTATDAPATDPGDDAEASAAAAETDVTEPSGGIPAWGWLVAALAAVGLVACGFLAFRRN